MNIVNFNEKILNLVVFLFLLILAVGLFYAGEHLNLRAVETVRYFTDIF